MKRRVPLQRKKPLARSQRPLKRTKLSPMSKKRAKEHREYGKLRTTFLDLNPGCQKCMAAPSEQIHHIHGRSGTNFLDVKTWAALCAPCHQKVHDNPNAARRDGWLKF